MIEIKHLSKTFQMKDGAVNALKDINLTIPDGSIYGIIGMSGAGKSTLVRCINLLERPTGGSHQVCCEDFLLSAPLPLPRLHVMAQGLYQARSFLFSLSTAMQIGRASCRERV